MARKRKSTQKIRHYRMMLRYKDVIICRNGYRDYSFDVLGLKFFKYPTQEACKVKISELTSPSYR